MGYGMDQTDGSFMIKNENKEKAYNLLMEYLKENSYDHAYKEGDMKDIYDAFRYYGFVFFENEKGDIYSICFESEKLTDQEVFFTAIAPVVEEGSFLEMRGEDNCLWRWVFRDGGCGTIYPKIIWDDDVE